MRRTLRVVLLTCLVGPVATETDARAQLRVDALAPKPADRISIFAVRGDGVGIPLIAFNEFARRAVEAHMHAEIVSMDEMLARGGPALSRRMAVCQGDPRCFAEVIGRTVDTRYLLVLTASVLGEARLLGARLLDLSTRSIVGEAIDEVPSDQSFLDAIPARIEASVPKERWDPFGGLEIEVLEPGAQITINGRIVGMSPIAAMPYLLPGTYEIAAEKEGYLPGRQTVEVTRGATAKAVIPLAAMPADAPGTAWWIWAGAGAAAVGLLVTGVVLVTTGGDDPTFCSASARDLCAL